MSSRNTLKYTTSVSTPGTAQDGDEYYNPTTGKLYKNVVVNGTTLTFVEIPVANKPVNITDSTPSYTTSTGALKVAGGVGIGGSLYVGSDINFVGSLYQNGVLFSGSSGSGGTNRVVIISDGTSVTINGDTTDTAVQTNTQAAGTLTINAITGTPANGQKILFRLQSNNVQTFAWNAVFAGSTDLSLPIASSGGAKYDYIGFIYNSTAAKWHAITRNFGF